MANVVADGGAHHHHHRRNTHHHHRPDERLGLIGNSRGLVYLWEDEPGVNRATGGTGNESARQYESRVWRARSLDFELAPEIIYDLWQAR
jgi:hypothetical protein